MESELGKGTTFHVYFDLLINETADVSNTYHLDATLAKQRKILILDDNITACHVFKHTLELYGFLVDITQKSDEAIQKLSLANDSDTPYSLVIIDQDIPDLNAHALVKKLQELQLKITPAFLATTACGGEEMFTIQKSEVFAGIIIKPVLPQTLWGIVMNALKIDVPNMQERKRDTTENIENYKNLNGMTVLYAEDNEINQEIMQALLQKLGAVLTLAQNGEHAVELCRKKRFDIILMDIQMPVMDGLTATKHIRSLDGFDKDSVPIIAMTAHAMQMHKEESIIAGMNGHLAKPIDPKKLRDTLLFWQEKLYFPGKVI